MINACGSCAGRQAWRFCNVQPGLIRIVQGDWLREELVREAQELGIVYGCGTGV